MPIDLRRLGDKITRYRMQFELSSAELSQSTGIPEDRIEEIELGQAQPTGDEILVLSDFFMCDYRFFISNQNLAPFEETETLFRKYDSDLSQKDRWAIQEVLYFSENESFLSDLVSHRSIRSFGYDKKGTYYKGHAAGAAAALRSHLGYTEHDIGSDVFEDLRSIGFHVFRRRLDNSSISGFFVRHPTAGPCICVNYDDDVYRQRFSAAHEAAHAILDDDEVATISKWSSHDLSEIRANTFASRFLMPPEILRSISLSEVWDAQTALKWANRLGVSTTALAYALSEEGLVGQTEQQTIESVVVPSSQKIDPELPPNLGSRERRRKKLLLERGLSDQYVRYCFEAYRSAKVSRAKAAEMLLSPVSHLADIAHLYQVTV